MKNKETSNNLIDLLVSELNKLDPNLLSKINEIYINHWIHSELYEIREKLSKDFKFPNNSFRIQEFGSRTKKVKSWFIKFIKLNEKIEISCVKIYYLNFEPFNRDICKIVFVDNCEQGIFLFKYDVIGYEDVGIKFSNKDELHELIAKSLIESKDFIIHYLQKLKKIEGL